MRPSPEARVRGGARGVRKAPIYVVYVKNLSKDCLPGAKDAHMVVISDAWKYGIRKIRFAQLAVDIIANINERKEDFFYLLKKSVK